MPYWTKIYFKLNKSVNIQYKILYQRPSKSQGVSCFLESIDYLTEKLNDAWSDSE